MRRQRSNSAISRAICIGRCGLPANHCQSCCKVLGGTTSNACAPCSSTGAWWKAEMMANAIFLAALQHADSFFPTGASAFSWGIETAVADGHVTTAADLAEFVACQLTYRWA